jgi:hypothetical protein
MAQERPDDSDDLFGYDPGARPPIPRPHLHGIPSSREDSSSRIPPSGPSGGHRLDQLGGALRDAFSRSYLRARKLVAERPVQTIAAIAGACLAFGVGLRLRSSHRR